MEILKTEPRPESSAQPLMLNNEDSNAKLITLSKNFRNARLSWDMGHPKLLNEDCTKTSSLRDVRRSSLWDMQKENVIKGVEIRAYKRRWIMLFLYFFFVFLGTYQWSMYTIISNVVQKYYRVSSRTVDFTALTSLVTSLMLFLPAGWMLNKMGTRRAMLLSCALNTIGCFVRLFAVPADRFWLAMIGQIIVGLSQAFVCMIPARLSAQWFPAHQVSFACAASLNGMMIGNAIGFLLPPLIIRNSDNMDDIASDFSRTYIGLAACALISLVLTAAFLQDEPPLPPSQAQRLIRLRKASQKDPDSPKEYLQTLKRLFKKRTYLNLLISFSIINSIFCALSTKMNDIIIAHFPGSEKEVGVFGLLLVLPGILCSGVTGYILDRTHAFKTTTMILYITTLAGWISWSVLLRFDNIYYLYISSAILGLATGGVWPVGLDFGVEMTYPEPEGTTSGLLSAGVQCLQIIATLIYGYILQEWKEDVANAILGSVLGIACLMLAFMRPTLKRHAAQQTKGFGPHGNGIINC